MLNFFKKINIFKVNWTPVVQVGGKLKQYHGKMFIKNRLKSYLTGGFTLFELLVVIAVTAIVTAVTFSNFPKMDSKLSLELLAQDIALTIRQAQIYGTTVYGAQGNFDSYGVDFPNPKDLSISPTNPYKITIFADLKNIQNDFSFDPAFPELTNNYAYDGSQNGICGSPSVVTQPNQADNSECLEEFRLTGRNRISNICVNYYIAEGDLDLTTGLSPKEARIKNCLAEELEASYFNETPPNYIPDVQSTKRTTIVYRRPNLDPTITTFKEDSGFCNSNTGSDCSNIGIVVSSDSGDTRVVVVWANGQISIDK